jgi:hypothetical protein
MCRDTCTLRPRELFATHARAAQVPRMHFVAPVLSATRRRLSLFGWWLAPGQLYELDTAEGESESGGEEGEEGKDTEEGEEGEDELDGESEDGEGGEGGGVEDHGENHGEGRACGGEGEKRQGRGGKGKEKSDAGSGGEGQPSMVVVAVGGGGGSGGAKAPYVAKGAGKRRRR